MTITSFSFLIFLLISVLVFYICPVKFRWIVLLISSLAFYVLAGAFSFLPFIVLTSLAVWLCSVRIGGLWEEQDRALEAETDRAAKRSIRDTYRKRAKRFLLLALVLCVGVLCVSKFWRYAADILNRIAGMLQGKEPFDAAAVIVPLGISYYTFSTAGYLMDVYWKRYPYEKNYARFLLFAAYFPHIVQGPISRYNLLGQELKKELTFDSKRVWFGIELMLWGFFKKLVIADRLSIFVSGVFNYGDHAGSIFLVAIIFDVVQIYADFSGYMDIVRGVSQIFGVELEQNFDHPFGSETVPEFWRRWHMTLGAWFKDYVYYPVTVSHPVKSLTRSAKKNLSERMARLVAVLIPVYVTWVLTGLWHGTGKSYLVWGLYYGTLFAISTAFQPEFAKLNEKLHINTDCFSWHLFRKVRTCCCFAGGRLLTSPGWLRYSALIAKTLICGFGPMALLDGSLYTFGLNARNFWLAVICILILWAVSMMQQRFCIREKLAEQNIVFRWLILYLAIFAILIFGVYGIGYDAGSFVYEQF